MPGTSLSKFRVCSSCHYNKPIHDFYPRPGKHEGQHQIKCKACVDEEWRANREKRAPVINVNPTPTDEHGNILPYGESGKPVRYRKPRLSEEQMEAMVTKAVLTPFLQDIADAGGITLPTLRNYLEKDIEPYITFAADLRSAINTEHRERLWMNLLAASDLGDTRATIEALKAVDPETFREQKKQVDLTVRRTDDEVDLSQLTDEEFEQLQAIKAKVIGGGQ